MAETTAHTEVPGGHKGVFPPFNKETFPTQLTWLGITFILLYVMMAKVALPRIGSILEERRGHIDGAIAEAERFKSDSEAAVAAYEKALAEARGKAHAIAGATRDKLNAEADERRKAIEAQLALKLAAAETTIADDQGQGDGQCRGDRHRGGVGHRREADRQDAVRPTPSVPRWPARHGEDGHDRFA